MTIDIKMPALSQTTDNVHLVGWVVKVGDYVNEGSPLCEVETDKATMEVESFTQGTVVELLASEGTDVQVGTPIARLAEGQKKVHPPAESHNVLISPMVRHKADKMGLDVSRIKGSGPGGMITEIDLFRSFKGEDGEKDKNGSPVKGQDKVLDFEEVSLSSNQNIIAQLFVQSKKEIPHIAIRSTVFMENLLLFRNHHLAEAKKKYSFYTLFISKIARVLEDFPIVNSCCYSGKIRRYGHINIAFAVAVKEDLFAPVIRDANRKSIADIDARVKKLAKKAHEGTLSPEDVSGATFIVSNLGMYPVDSFTAIISPKQGGIITIGSVHNEVVAQDETTLSIRKTAHVVGNFDHRIINGAVGAAFLGAIKQAIEEERG